MTKIESLILGIIQGLTEFLPISSSGHLELGGYFLGIETKDNLLFAIIVHGATALSTIVVFRKSITVLLQDVFTLKRNDSTTYISKIVLSAIPVGIVGIFFEEQIKELFTGNVVFVAFMLGITGILLSATYFSKVSDGEISFAKAFFIGVAQAIAILPGISRSGATISTALLFGVDREKATQFSFLMVLIPILGAMLLKIKDIMLNPELVSGMGFEALLIGFAAAFVTGLFACKWMLAIVRKGKLFYFAIYCFVVGASVLIAYW